MKKNYVVGFIFITLLGSLLHFTYDWSNQNFFVGLFSATNESVFEHTKLVLLPTVLWYLLNFFRNKNIQNKNKYLNSMLISLVTSILTIPLLYYFYTFGLNVLLDFINIINFFVSVLLGQTLAHHYYKYSNKSLPNIVIFLLIILLFIMYFYLTYNPLDLPIFI